MTLLPRILATALAAMAYTGGAFGAEAAERNVFAPNAAVARTDGATSALPLPPPPPALPPILRLPPPIPSVEGRVSLPPVLPPAPGTGTAPAKGADVAASTPKRVFLTRQELESQRSGCDIVRKGSGAEQVPASGGRLVLRYSLSNGRTCLSGAASDSTWANVARADGAEVTVRVMANDSREARETTVTVVSRSGRSAAYLISQPGAGK